MNPDTGAIAHFENDEDAEQAQHTVLIPEEVVERLKALPRDERMKEVMRLIDAGELSKNGLSKVFRDLQNKASESAKAFEDFGERVPFISKSRSVGWSTSVSRSEYGAVMHYLTTKGPMSKRSRRTKRKAAKAARRGNR